MADDKMLADEKIPCPCGTCDRRDTIRCKSGCVEFRAWFYEIWPIVCREIRENAKEPERHDL